MIRRWFITALGSFFLPLGSKRGVDVTLRGLDPRFVEQLKVAAKSRGKTLEGYIVYAALMMSGYHENNGFIE